jgi:hypothetical protein
MLELVVPIVLYTGTARWDTVGTMVDIVELAALLNA